MLCGEREERERREERREREREMERERDLMKWQSDDEKMTVRPCLISVLMGGG